MASLQRISPCLWFSDQAEQAVAFYSSVFKGAKISRVTRYGQAGREVHGRPAGSVMTIEFELDGTPFTALNAGPAFTFNEAVSMQVHCDSQQEIDYYWERLGQGGDPKAQQCGWLKDRFGLSWQIVPRVLSDMLADADHAKSGRAMTSMLQMKKFDIAALQRAFEG